MNRSWFEHIMIPPGPCVKEKIGFHLSYPVKFSELSELLVPALDKLGVEIWFWAWKPPRQHETRASYQVFEIKYDPNNEPAWWICVAPIPRAVRATIHPLLVQVLSGRVRSWLLEDRGSGWYSRYHALRIRYNSVSEDLDFEERNAA